MFCKLSVDDPKIMEPCTGMAHTIPSATESPMGPQPPGPQHPGGEGVFPFDFELFYPIIDHDRVFEPDHRRYFDFAPIKVHPAMLMRAESTLETPRLLGWLYIVRRLEYLENAIVRHARDMAALSPPWLSIAGKILYAEGSL